MLTSCLVYKIWLLRYRYIQWEIFVDLYDCYITIYIKYFSESVVLCHNASDWSERQGRVQKTWFVMEMHSMSCGAQRLALCRAGHGHTEREPLEQVLRIDIKVQNWLLACAIDSADYCYFTISINSTYEIISAIG